MPVVNVRFSGTFVGYKSCQHDASKSAEKGNIINDFNVTHMRNCKNLFCSRFAIFVSVFFHKFQFAADFPAGGGGYGNVFSDVLNPITKPVAPLGGNA